MLLLSCVFLAASGAIEAVSTVNGLSAHISYQDMQCQQLQNMIEAMSNFDLDDEHSFITRSLNTPN